MANTRRIDARRIIAAVALAIASPLSAQTTSYYTNSDGTVSQAHVMLCPSTGGTTTTCTFGGGSGGGGGLGGLATTASPTYTNGATVTNFSFDLSGNLRVSGSSVPVGTAGSPNANVLTIQGISGGTPQAISATALPLPAGAATAAGLTAINTTLGSPLQAGGSVGISGALPTGTNTIGTVNIGTGTGTSAADAQATSTTLVPSTAVLLGYNGTTFDRLRSVNGALNVNAIGTALESGGNLALAAAEIGATTSPATGTVNAQLATAVAKLTAAVTALQGTLTVQATRNSPDVVSTLSLDLTTLNAVTAWVAPAGQGTGTFVIPALNGATVVVESSSDGGTTVVTHGVHQAGVGTFQSSSSTITAAGVYRVNLNSVGLIRLRTSVVGTGTLAPTLRMTAGSGIVNTVGLSVSGTTGGATPFKLITTASSNSTLVSTGPHTLYSMTITGQNTTAAYVHVMDLAAANCSAISLHTYLVIGSTTAQGGLVVPIPSVGEAYVNGLTFCVTGAMTDGDTSSAPAGVLVNLSYK